MLISTTPVGYQTHPGPLIILDGTTSHTNSNMQIAHTKEVRLFREVTGSEQALVQQIIATAEEAYLTDSHNRTTNSINDNVADLITHLKENYGQLMHQKLL